MLICTSEGVAPFVFTTTAVGSRIPMGSTPLNSLRARESQKLRWLNTALIVVGVLRGSTLRTSLPPTLKTEPKPVVEKLPWSNGKKPSPGTLIALKAALKTP